MLVYTCIVHIFSYKLILSTYFFTNCGKKLNNNYITHAINKQCDQIAKATKQKIHPINDGDIANCTRIIRPCLFKNLIHLSVDLEKTRAKYLNKM